MVPRYTRPDMGKIWSEQNRYLCWLKVEYAVCEELARSKQIPPRQWKILKGKLEKLIKKGGVDPKRVEFHEKTTRHDVIAFTTAVAEVVGPTSRYVHFGLTSSDVLDTALALQVQESAEHLMTGLDQLMKSLKKLARQHQKLATIGRSHGIFAEPTSFGLKFLGWYCEWQRNRQRLINAQEGLRYGKLSGAVGVNAHWDPQFEKKVLSRLKLKREPVATQVIPRDRHAEWFNSTALCGCTLERMSVELRHLQRSEVDEVMEGFAKGQKGSSAMPHKRNPISAENLTGLARLLRGHAHSAMENIALWHERDISHSSVERVIFPDAAILLDYAIDRMNRVLQNLVVREDQVQTNLERAGKTVYSGHLLLALVDAGASREESYYWIQECAHAAMNAPESKKSMSNGVSAQKTQDLFLDQVKKHPKIARYLKAAEVKKLGSVQHQLRNVDKIFREVL